MRIINTFFVLGAAHVLGQQQENSSSIIYQLSSDPEFAFLLEEYMSLSNGGGANTGEVLRLASQITPGDFESWYSEFKYMADALHEKADAIDKKRFPVSARDTYFRSASYYRGADFFLHSNQSDPRIFSLWDSALADFDTATSLLPNPPFRKNLTGDSFDIPIMFFPAASIGHGNHNASRPQERIPTVIVGSGYDGSQEAIYHSIGRAITERGWNYVSYEGPGQPTVRRQQKIGFIPNWWDVVTPIVDYLESRPDVDPRKIALVGESFGGTLAPMAASREHRISAVLAIDGLMSLFKALTSQLPDSLNNLFASGNSEVFDETMLGIMNNATTPTQFRWVIAQGLWSFNTTSPFEWFTRLSKIALDEEIVANITCPTFVGDGEHDTLAGSGQPQELAAALGSLATYNQFKQDLGAGEHCQIGAEAQLAQVSLDWLGDVWDGIKLPNNITGGTY
ncbi:unnamed protein product [Clonostachys solani]|uniref:BAAT/Acyl-CoA thioester hydrolase C-terminal domain-containing protein n=1 Tax=Clonostachys solani TaxID=160281 RepID=A0A9P0EHV5_9HYPO|nr:unnamed protein product [Clonostachys solani]